MGTIQPNMDIDPLEAYSQGATGALRQRHLPGHPVSNAPVT